MPVIKSRRFPPFLPIFSLPPTHSQVDRCRDVKLIFAGKGVGETLNILVHRRSMGARERRRFIIRRDRMEKRILCHRFPPFSFTYRVPRKGATRIDPSVARDESPANAPPKQIFAPRKRNISPVPLSTFLKRFAQPAAAPRTFDSNLAVFDQRPTD